MKLSQAKIALLAVVLVLPATLSGCVLVNRIRAKNAVNEGAKAFKEGRFAEAKEKFELAYSLDPEQKNTPYLIARSIHEQYKPGVTTDENIAKAEESIKAYENVLNNSDADAQVKDKSYEAIVYFFNMLGREKEGDDWLTQRAKAENVPPEKRADAYTVLASRKATRSSTITENNRKDEEKEIGKYTYVMPANQDEFRQAVADVEEGERLIKEALALNDKSAEAWRVKATLLREKGKLAVMEKKPQPDVDAINNDANNAYAEYERLDAEAKQKKAEEEAKKEKKA